MKKKSWVYLAVAFVIVAIVAVMSFINPSSVGEEYEPKAYATVFALVPPLIAIALALITKEVYSSLFVGIAVGALIYANGNAALAFNTMLLNEAGGMVFQLADSYNVGILIFLVVLGIMVALMNKVGGSAAFGKWASEHIKTKVGAQLATMLLGVLIFIDDYFNCLTVGSVMRPVTDNNKISRAKLAYLIDATAAPICIIAPISSWAAAVSSYIPEEYDINGFSLFLKTIPYNFYALGTFVMMIVLIIMKVDFGKMKIHEDNAEKGDLFTTKERPYAELDKEGDVPQGKVIDLLLPVIALIVCCAFGMVYSGGIFDGNSFIDSFAGCDASVGLVLGSFMALLITFVFYMVRQKMSFGEFMKCIPEGFKAMAGAIIILTFAWTLKGITGLLGADVFIANIVEASSGALKMLLPVILFMVALVLAFASGTSWGTFGILIPIICAACEADGMGKMLVVCIAAALAGAVCGDHCSPISDTTIMASSGAHCDHVNHVSTQLPYAMVVAGASLIGYLVSGIITYFSVEGMGLIALPLVFVLIVAALFTIKTIQKKKA